MFLHHQSPLLTKFYYDCKKSIWMSHEPSWASFYGEWEIITNHFRLKSLFLIITNAILVKYLFKKSFSVRWMNFLCTYDTSEGISPQFFTSSSLCWCFFEWNFFLSIYGHAWMCCEQEKRKIIDFHFHFHWAVVTSKFFMALTLNAALYKKLAVLCKKWTLPLYIRELTYRVALKLGVKL